MLHTPRGFTVARRDPSGPAKHNPGDLIALGLHAGQRSRSRLIGAQAPTDAGETHLASTQNNRCAPGESVGQAAKPVTLRASRSASNAFSSASLTAQTSSQHLAASTVTWATDPFGRRPILRRPLVGHSQLQE